MSRNHSPEFVQAAYATFETRNHLIGYFSQASTKEDIEAYLEDNVGYGLEIKVCEIIDIPEGYADEKRRKEAEIARLQQEIDNLRNS